MTRTGRFSATAAAFLVTACATQGTPAGSARDFSPNASGVTEVVVTNHNWSDMRVYVVSSGMRTRLGTVSTSTTAVFRLPRTLTLSSGPLQLLADPIGSRDAHVTQPLTIMPGQRVRFEIENHLAISSVVVW